MNICSANCHSLATLAYQAAQRQPDIASSEANNTAETNHNTRSDDANHAHKKPEKIEKTDPLQDPASPESNKLKKLQARDQEVRAHEAAHLAAAGPYASGGMRLSYQEGPDGKRYAIGGSVSIDTSAVAGDPQATLEKARIIRRAALAPAQPSGQDHSVAAQASQMETQAAAKLAKENRSEDSSSTDAVDQKPASPSENTSANANGEPNHNRSDNPLPTLSAAASLERRFRASGALDNAHASNTLNNLYA